METRIRHLPKSQVELVISLAAEEVDKHFKKVYDELSRSGSIPGFRPGKAPPIIVRRYFGADHVKGATWIELVQDSLEKALEDHPDLQIIGEPVLPDIEEVELAEGKPVELVVLLTVYPKAELEPVEGVKLLRPPREVPEEDVQKVLDQLREDEAEWVEVSRAIQPGDRVTADVVVVVDGAEKARQEDVEIIAQPRSEEEGKRSLAELMAGHLVGQEVTLEEEVAEDEGGELAGKKVVYTATIKKVEEKRLPELDDEFAAEVSDATSLEELMSTIREQLSERLEQEARKRMEVQAIAYLLAHCDVDLPDALIAQATQARLDDLDSALAESGSSLEELAEVGAVNREDVESAQRHQAILSLETELALQALIEREGLEPEEEDRRAAIEELAERTRSTVRFVEQAYEVQDEVAEQIDERARRIRALRWIIERAEIEEVPREEFEERHKALLDELEQRRVKRRQAMAGEGEEQEEGEAEAGEVESAPEEAEASASEEGGEPTGGEDEEAGADEAAAETVGSERERAAAVGEESRPNTDEQADSPSGDSG